MKPPPLKQTSWAERGIIMDALVAMHMRSEAASAPANAQQHPQLDWSRMSPMIFAQLGQFCSESKLSGTRALELAESSILISPFATKSATAFFWSPLTPIMSFDAPG